MILFSEYDEIEIEPKNWVLAVDLIKTHGHSVDSAAKKLNVKNLKKVTSVLNAWGVPWKWVP